MNKSLLYLYLATSAFLFGGCTGSDDGDGPENRIPLSVSQQSFVFSSDVDDQALGIQTSASWTATSDVEWCKPRKESGKGPYELSLWVSPNITKTARHGQITVKAGNEIQTVNISQPAYSGDPETFVYRLPVIFHVLYKNRNDRKQNVTQAWLAEILNRVNGAYRDNGMNIEFRMAEIDQNGDTLTEAGVMRKQVDFDSMESEIFLNYDNKKYGNLNQNFQRYINIFVFTFSDDNVMGLTTLPNMPSTRKLDGLGDMPGSTLQSIKTLDFPWGVAINNSYIYENQEEGYMNPMYIVTTLAHELGHYLGLLHTFSEDGCNEDDYCEDTKNCDYNAYVDGLMSYLNSLQPGESVSGRILLTRSACEDGELYYADNILDYMYTLAETMTADQRTRTRRVLNYCPMVPGPKAETWQVKGSRAPISIPPRLSGCPGVPSKPGSHLGKRLPAEWGTGRSATGRDARPSPQWLQ